MTIGFGFSVTPEEPLAVGAEMRRAEELGYCMCFSLEDYDKPDGAKYVEDGRLLGSPADGRFVKRRLEPAVLEAPRF